MTSALDNAIRNAVEDDLITAAPSSLRLEGVTPARQARSQATFRALIVAGRKALEQKNFDAVTIEEIAQAAGASVGAFYGRFANKEAFFAAIQEITVSDVEAQLRRLLADRKVGAAENAVFMRSITRFWVNIYRKNRGLYLAAFKHSSSLPGAWTPFKRLGWTCAGLVCAALLPRLKADGRRISEKDVRAAFQFVNGLLVNAVVNDPGPISLDYPEMEDMVERFFCSFFGIGDAPPKTRRRKETR